MGDIHMHIGPACRLAQDVPIWMLHAVNQWAKWQAHLSIIVEMDEAATGSLLMPEALEANVQINTRRKGKWAMPQKPGWFASLFAKKDQPYCMELGSSKALDACLHLLPGTSNPDKPDRHFKKLLVQPGPGFLIAYRWQSDSLIKMGFPQHRLMVAHLHVPFAGATPTFADRERWKQQNTGGQEYWICFAEALGLPDFIELLKAFGQLKKWQGTGMKMVIMGSLQMPRQITERLASYKHRADVQMLPWGPAAECMHWVQHAYAVLTGPGFVNGSLSVYSVRSGVPILSLKQPILEELLNRSYFRLAAWNCDELSQTLQLVFKEENLRASTTAAAAAASMQLMENALPEALHKAYEAWTSRN